MPVVMERSQGIVARGLGDPAPYLLPEETVLVSVRRHVMVLMAAFLETLGFVGGAFMIQVLIEYVPAVETITLLIALAALLRFAYLVLEWRMERFVITNQRMMLVGGVFTRRVAVMPIRKVTDLTFEKPLIGQIFNYGTFVVESAGQDQAMSRVEYLPQANRLYLKVSDLLFGNSLPSVETDLVADPPVDGAIPAYDRDQTDPHLGDHLAGLDFDGDLHDDGPITDRFAVPARPLQGMVHEPSSAATRMRSRLGGLNGRGTRRGPGDVDGDGGPIVDHRR